MPGWLCGYGRSPLTKLFTLPTWANSPDTERV